MPFNKDLTIAIPVYERFDYFEQALRSAIDQTIQCNIIIIDNCSSHSQFKDYVEKLSLPFIQYYRNEKVLPMIANWNECLNRCDTEWVTILHDDDLLAKVFVEHISNLINLYPQSLTFMVGYSVGEAPGNVFIENTEELKSEIKKIRPVDFTFGNVTPFPGVVFNLKESNQVRFDDTTYPIQDFDLWYRLSCLQPILFSKNILAFYRISPVQESSNIHAELVKACHRYIKLKIGYQNCLYKIFAFWRLYQMHLGHRKIYKISAKDHIAFDDKELNMYFNLFSIPVSKVFFSLAYPVFKKLRTIA